MDPLLITTGAGLLGMLLLVAKVVLQRAEIALLRRKRDALADQVLTLRLRTGVDTATHGRLIKQYNELAAEHDALLAARERRLANLRGANERRRAEAQAAKVKA